MRTVWYNCQRWLPFSGLMKSVTRALRWERPQLHGCCTFHCCCLIITNKGLRLQFALAWGVGAWAADKQRRPKCCDNLFMLSRPHASFWLQGSQPACSFNCHQPPPSPPPPHTVTPPGVCCTRSLYVWLRPVALQQAGPRWRCRAFAAAAQHRCITAACCTCASPFSCWRPVRPPPHSRRAPTAWCHHALAAVTPAGPSDAHLGGTAGAAVA